MGKIWLSLNGMAMGALTLVHVSSLAATVTSHAGSEAFRPAADEKPAARPACATRVAAQSEGSESVPNDDRILQDLGNHRLLAADEERALLRAVKLERELLSHDWELLARVGLSSATLDLKEAAKETLVRLNMRLAINVSASFRDHYHRIPRLELVFAGRRGLERAVDDFKLEHATRFGTYATWKVRHEMQALIFREGYLARVPAYRLEAFRRWNAAQGRLEQRLGRHPTFEESHAALKEETRTKLVEELKREPSDEELSKRLPKDFEDPEKFALEMRKVARHINVGVESQMGSADVQGDGAGPLDLAADHAATTPHQELIRDAYSTAIRQALGREPRAAGTPPPLEPREALVVEARFALWGAGGLFRLLQIRFRDREITEDDLVFLADLFGVDVDQLERIQAGNQTLAADVAHVFSLSDEEALPLDPLAPTGLERLGTLFQRTAAEVGKRETTPLTLKQLGYLLGITRERVRQIEADSLESLREWLVAQVGELDPEEDY